MSPILLNMRYNPSYTSYLTYLHLDFDQIEFGFFVGIHTEGEFAGQIKKAQPINDQQLKTLQEENRMD